MACTYIYTNTTYTYYFQLPLVPCRKKVIGNSSYIKLHVSSFYFMLQMSYSGIFISFINLLKIIVKHFTYMKVQIVLTSFYNISWWKKNNVLFFNLRHRKALRAKRNSTVKLI